MSSKLKLSIIALALLATVSVACNIRPPGQATPTPVVQPGPQSPAPVPTQGPPAPPAPQPTTPPAPPPASTAAPAPAPTQAPRPAAQPTAVPPSGGINFCNKTFPSGSVLFPVSKDARYNYVFDPSQSGVAGRQPLGWYYQPCLPPASERVPHELPLVMIPGRYDFTGPECTVWLNASGSDATASDKGQVLVDRANVVIDVATTAGRNESWIFVRCNGGAASGSSFSRLN